MVGGGVGGGEKRRPCGKRRDLHQAPFSSLEAFATPGTPAVLHPQPPLLPRPALLGWGPLSPVPAAPPHPEGKGRGPRETSGRSRPTRAPTRAPAAPALSRGHSGPLPAAPRAQPRPAAAEPLPGADFWRGGACSARRAGSGPEEGMGDGGGVRGGRGRDGGGQAAPPFPAAAADRRAEGRSAPGPAAGVGASPGQGVRGVGAGSRVLTLRSCSQRTQCSLACD